MIRKGTLKDLSEIWKIEERVFRTPWSKESLQDELRLRTDRNVFVYESEQIVAYIMIRLSENEAQVLNIAVDLEYQHKGYGDRLLKYTLDELGNETDVFLEVRESNLPAIKLYSDNDFEEIGIREQYYSDGEDAIVMKRKAMNYGLV